MSEGAPGDTDAATLRMLDELYARMSPAEKLERVAELSVGASRLALTGLRARHPDLTEEELLLRLAEIRLGSELFEAVYGREGT